MERGWRPVPVNQPMTGAPSDIVRDRCNPFFGAEGVRPAFGRFRREERMRLRRREKVFGPGWAVPLDRNAKARIVAYARAWTARHKAPGQHKGPITRAFLDVLQALLWGFHNSRSGACFPSYERIAEKAGCCRPPPSACSPSCSPEATRADAAWRAWHRKGST